MYFPGPTSEGEITDERVMPSESDPSKDVAETASGKGGFNDVSVYVLDDDPSMLKALGRLLKAEEFRVEKFNNPTAFLSAVKRNGCTVAILDVCMPQMNGFDVQSVLKRDSPGTRIIFINGRDDPSVRQVALNTGAFGFLSKPLDNERLLNLVNKAIAA